MALPTAERWEQAKTHQLCFKCLNKGHSTRLCPDNRACGWQGCRRHHNRLLHEERESQCPLAAIEAGAHFVESGIDCLYKYVPITVSGPRGTRRVLAFIDEGSKVSLMDQRLAQELGIQGRRRRIDLKWIDGQVKKCDAWEMNVNIQSFVAKDVLAVPGLNLPKQSFNPKELAKSFPVVNSIPLQAYKEEQPRLLLGLPHTRLIRPQNIIPLGEDYMAQETGIGWTVFGGVTTDKGMSHESAQPMNHAPHSRLGARQGRRGGCHYPLPFHPAAQQAGSELGQVRGTDQGRAGCHGQGQRTKGRAKTPTTSRTRFSPPTTPSTTS